MPCYHRLQLVHGYLSDAFHTEMHNRGSALRCLHPEDDELLVLFEYSVARVFSNLIDFYAYHPPSSAFVRWGHLIRMPLFCAINARGCPTNPLNFEYMQRCREYR